MVDGEGLDMVFLSKNFKNFINKKALAKMGDKRNERPQCYECKGFRHIRHECPHLIKEEENNRSKEKKDT